MDHVAIMNKKLGLIDKILSGEKTIESRWTKNKIAPWDKIKIGEIVYFKESGGLVRAKALVAKVLQFTALDFPEVINKYGGEKQINLSDRNPRSEYYTSKNYCVLIFLKDIRSIPPFAINKSGFGSAAAWLITPSIKFIKAY